jgi:ABC-type glycerol-3-phosphate transport system substrate-binding protein
LLDLNAQTSADKTWKADVYYPRALTAFQKDGKQFALPASFSTVLLFYNKTLFDTAKVDYPKADWKWDDAVAAAKDGQKVPTGCYNVGTMLGGLIKHGGAVGICGSCIDARGIGESELVAGARRSSMDELTA